RSRVSSHPAGRERYQVRGHSCDPLTGTPELAQQPTRRLGVLAPMRRHLATPPGAPRESRADHRSGIPSALLARLAERESLRRGRRAGRRFERPPMASVARAPPEPLAPAAVRSASLPDRMGPARPHAGPPTTALGKRAVLAGVRCDFCRRRAPLPTAWSPLHGLTKPNSQGGFCSAPHETAAGWLARLPVVPG